MRGMTSVTRLLPWLAYTAFWAGIGLFFSLAEWQRYVQFGGPHPWEPFLWELSGSLTAGALAVAVHRWNEWLLARGRGRGRRGAPGRRRRVFARALRLDVRHPLRRVRAGARRLQARQPADRSWLRRREGRGHLHADPGAVAGLALVPALAAAGGGGRAAQRPPGRGAPRAAAGTGAAALPVQHAQPDLVGDARGRRTRRPHPRRTGRPAAPVDERGPRRRAHAGARDALGRALPVHHAAALRRAAAHARRAVRGRGPLHRPDAAADGAGGERRQARRGPQRGRCRRGRDGRGRRRAAAHRRRRHRRRPGRDRSRRHRPGQRARAPGDAARRRRRRPLHREDGRTRVRVTLPARTEAGA